MHKKYWLFLTVNLIFIPSLYCQNKGDSTTLGQKGLIVKSATKDMVENTSIFDEYSSTTRKFIFAKVDSIKSISLYYGDDHTKLQAIKKTHIDSILNLLKSDSIIVIFKDNLDSTFRRYESLLDRQVTKNSEHLFSEKSEDKIDKPSEAVSNQRQWLLIILIIFSIISVNALFIWFLVKKHIWFTKKIALLKDEIVELKENYSKLHSNFQLLERDDNPTNEAEAKFTIKSEKEIEKTKAQIKDAIMRENTLDDSEITLLLAKRENRWLTVAHSAIGKNHSEANPVIPCQDNYFFENLNNDWQLAIVCDGAGSAKMSHFGSKVISKNIIPNNLKTKLNHLDWFKKGELPSKKEWEMIAKTILQTSYNDLDSWTKEQNELNKSNFSISDYASTIILAIYNSSGVLVANIGDGRGGYLNSYGELRPLFTPYGGDESNGTIFITSPIWQEPEKYVQSNVIEDELLSVFLLSDGMEKIAFECSNFTDDTFTDANTPYKKFFLPIFIKIKSLDSRGELKLIDEWKKLIESGNDSIKNEGDDKTLLVSFLK